MATIEINGKTYERRYLDSWCYNAALIMDELEKIVKDNGGKLVSTWKNDSRKRFAVTNRYISKLIHEQTEWVQKLRRVSAPGLAAAEDKLTSYLALDNEPRVTPYGDYRYINFTIGNTYFSYSMDSNPFFPFHYSKSTVDNGKIDRNTYSVEDEKTWCYDCFLRYDCSQEDRREAANLIFNMLMNAPVCRKAKPARLETLHEIS